MIVIDARALKAMPAWMQCGSSMRRFLIFIVSSWPFVAVTNDDIIVVNRKEVLVAKIKIFCSIVNAKRQGKRNSPAITTPGLLHSIGTVLEICLVIFF